MRETFGGQVALVTGAASGIGEALVEELLSAGARVVATDRDEARLKTLGGRLASDGLPVRVATLDVTDFAAWTACVAETVRREGRLDLLFNNAGVGLAGQVRDVSLTDWKRVIDVNLWGTIHGLHAAYPVMIEQGSGHIVNTASGAGLLPRPGMTPYAASKAAVVGLSTSLRGEAAELGVRVSAVCPGYIETDIMRSTDYRGVDGASLIEGLRVKPMSARRCAQTILRGVRRNRAIIPVTALTWLEWLLYRLSPSLVIRLARARARRFEELRLPPPSESRDEPVPPRSPS